MNEPKTFASLSSTLLARKGQAKPAMRPQGFAGFGMATAPSYDDLGWNDMGHEPQPQESYSAEIVPIVPEAVAEPAANAPVPVETCIVERPQVLHQQEKLERDLAPARRPRAAPGSKGKAAFTLRLDPERHLKLRLVCAISHRSAQQIVAEALDTYLATHPAVAELAATSKSKR